MLIEKAADLILSSKHAVALTGAGISTPSGIPDFRSIKDGLWQKYNPMEVASLSVFRLRPERFFEWFRPLTRQITSALPNKAHTALSTMQSLGLLKSIVTQNIDGLHQKAGSTSVLEVHGTLNTLTCVNCYTTFESGEFLESYIDFGAIPKCKECQGILKPDVILFEEQLPHQTWLKVEQEVNKCDLMIVAGSSLEVIPVARLPYQAASKGAKLVIINNQETYIDSKADVVLHEDVAIVLPKILEHISDVRTL